MIKLSSFWVILESQDWTENRILDIFWTYLLNVTEILRHYIIRIMTLNILFVGGMYDTHNEIW